MFSTNMCGETFRPQWVTDEKPFAVGNSTTKKECLALKRKVLASFFPLLFLLLWRFKKEKIGENIHFPVDPKMVQPRKLYWTWFYYLFYLLRAVGLVNNTTKLLYSRFECFSCVLCFLVCCHWPIGLSIAILVALCYFEFIFSVYIALILLM